MFSIDARSRVPIYEQLISSIKEFSVSGVLKADEKLPSVRDLSKQLTINPNTIQKAYQELERQGIIYVERGRGTFVSPNIKASNREVRMEKLEDSIRKILVECIYLDIGKDELFKMISNSYNDIVENPKIGESKNGGE